jgi:hypothetical protein
VTISPSNRADPSRTCPRPLSQLLPESQPKPLLRAAVEHQARLPPRHEV